MTPRPIGAARTEQAASHAIAACLDLDRAVDAPPEDRLRLLREARRLLRRADALCQSAAGLTVTEVPT